MLFRSGVVAGLGLWLAAPLAAQRMHNQAISSLMPLYALYVCCVIASEHFVSFMVSQDRYRVAVGFETTETVVRVLILLAPLWWGFGLEGLVVGTAIYAALRLVVRSIWLLRGADPVAGDWRSHTFMREQLAYAIPVGLTSVVGLVAGILDRAIVATFFTPVHYAIYSVGAIEIPLDVIFQASVANVLRTWLPGLVRDGNMDEIARLMREAVRKLSLIVLPSFVFLYGYADDLITLLFTKNYAESVVVLRIYLFLVPLHMFILSPIPQAFGKTRLNFYIVLGITTVNVTLSFSLLKLVGFYGPAISTVTCQYAQAVVFFIVAMRLTGARVSQLLPLASLLRVALTAAVALGASWALSGLSTSVFLKLLVAGSTYSVVFLGLAALTNTLTADDRRLILKWVGKVVPLGRWGGV